MASLNQCNFIGNCADTPEVRTFNDGGKIANIRIAVTERFVDRNQQQQERTEWVSVVFNGKLADIAEKYITKGSSIFVSGKLHNRQWTDQQGNKHTATEISALTLQLLDKKPQQTQQTAPQPQYRQPAPAQPAYQQAPPAPRPQYPAPPQAAPAPQFAPAPQQPQYQQPVPQPGQPGNTQYPPANSPEYTAENPDDLPW